VNEVVVAYNFKSLLPMIACGIINNYILTLFPLFNELDTSMENGIASEPTL